MNIVEQKGLEVYVNGNLYCTCVTVGAAWAVADLLANCSGFLKGGS